MHLPWSLVRGAFVSLLACLSSLTHLLPIILLFQSFRVQCYRVPLIPLKELFRSNYMRYSKKIQCLGDGFLPGF